MMNRPVGLLLGLGLTFYAGSAFAQNEKVSLNRQHAKTIQVLNDIEKQTNYLFVYDKKNVDTNRAISINASNQTVASVLQQLFAGTGVTYEMEGNNIVLTRQTATSASTQQSKRVKGTVVDKNGEPIIGANVVVKGTTNGTITDIDGKFSLEVSDGALLDVSYIGYLNQEIKVGNQKQLAISLSEDTQNLDEVVVVGYGTQKKANLSGAVETVTSNMLQNRATNNIGVALQGLVPNLQVTPNGGSANAEPSFNIRGETSINGGSPLILVDGIPTSAGDFARMNSMDIENISVLKDASSAAIYGARASFGVILVTTKKGKGDKIQVQFNNTYNVRNLTNMPKVVKDPYIQASYKKEMGKPWYDLYSDTELEYAQQLVNDPSLPSTIVNSTDPNKYTCLASTDWFDEIFDKFGTSHQHNLSLSGASQKASYYLGTEYYAESGMLHYNKDQYSRFNVRSNVEYRPYEWLKVGNNTAFTYYKYDKPTNFYSWMYNIANQTNTLVSVYNPDGSYTKEGAQLIGTLIDGGEQVTKNSALYTQFTAVADLIPHMWNVKADFTAKVNNNRIDTWDSDKNIPYRTGPNTTDIYLGWENYAQKSSAQTIYTLVNLYTDFHKDFGKHTVSAVAGYSQEYEHYNYLLSKRKDLITDTYPSVQLATGDMTMTEDDYTWTIRSAFYRLNYTFDNKYIVEVNGRYDGTSRFPSADRFGFFPSVSGAWVFSKENFMESAKSWLDHAKLRFSYGSLGNQNVSYYSYIASMTVSKMNYLLDGSKPMGVYQPGLISNSLTWEKVYTINGGIDLNLLSNRLILSGDVYRRDTKDMLTKGKTLPSVLGTAEPKINAADLKTRGWEVSVTWRDRFNMGSKPFNYSARFILSDSRSWITRFDNPTGILTDYYEGQELGEIWGLVTEGFFKDQADIDSHADQWSVMSYPGDRKLEPGDLKYKDLNGDGKINKGSNTVDDPGDFKIIGNNRSRYLYGLDLNADWNGFDLRMLFQGVGKRDWYPSLSEGGYRFYGVYLAPWGNVYENNLDHWTPENPDGYFPRLKSYLADGAGDMSYNQTRYLQNAAYLRCKNITFGYTLPKQLLQKIKLNNVRIYVSGENLFELTPLCKNFDPEQLNTTSHPLQRIYSIGLNISL